ncbi:MAG: T9SS type A sorting domain-containing protein [Candidatus Eisenbacteria bacterium]|uniref:T9SS type A sorting domain-containing protein n=1 Tax=Eiseniibacteriota bacterium TaxID=2212470 RepID=A0A956SDR9_UNCEI|nr:T9SS type A sorting domain-containing protein [Candidatus Eisenbacteria bacterium]MCB9462522.1 T9SS type A sorting domain-containing protein [Candidatus Eisenbacteria bacterium]
MKSSLRSTSARPIRRLSRFTPAFSLLATVLPVLGVSDAAAAWPEDGILVSPWVGVANSPSSCTDGAGGVFTFWADESALGVMGSHVFATGGKDPAWTDGGQFIGNGVGGQGSVGVVSDGVGGAIVTWHNGSTGNVLASHVLSDGVLDPSWPSVVIQVNSSTSASNSWAVPVPDANGGCIVTWLGLSNGETVVLVQRILSNGVQAPGWPEGGVVLDPVPGTPERPVACSDGEGGVIVAWDDAERIYVHHVLPSGQVDPDWPADGRLVSDLIALKLNPVVTTDGAGGAFVAWQDDRGGDGWDVFYSHVLANGEISANIPENGAVLTDAANNNSSGGWGDLTPDGAGGVYAVYEIRVAGHTDVWGQHILASSLPDWAPNGVPVCTSDGGGLDPSVIAHPEGGFLATWRDDFTYTRITRIGPDGNPAPGWTLDGEHRWFGIRAKAFDNGQGGAIFTLHRLNGPYESILVAYEPLAEPSAVGDGPRAGRTRLDPLVVPNPFSGSTSIAFRTERSQRVEVEIIDSAGRSVRHLTDEVLSSGRQRIVWDGSGDSGRDVAPGVYFYRIGSDDGTAAGRIVLTR